MNITELLAGYARDGVVVWAQDGQLRFRAPKGFLTDERRAELRAHKDAILRHLADEQNSRPLHHDEAGRHDPFP